MWTPNCNNSFMEPLITNYYWWSLDRNAIIMIVVTHVWSELILLFVKFMNGVGDCNWLQCLKT